MNTSLDHIIELLHNTSRCRAEVLMSAQKMVDLDAEFYNRMASDLTAKGADQPLGILLNVAAVNKIRLDPQVLADSLKTVAVIIDFNFPYKYQKEDAIEPLLTTAMAEDLSTERQVLAARLAAELAVKFNRETQPVKKVIWQLSTEMYGVQTRIMLDSALDLIEKKEATHARDRWFIEQDILKALPKERPSTVIAAGFTLRRPVTKLGRNEPCHCGSGRKYKKCCHARDEELLRDASPYEGVTKSQLLAEPSLVKDTAPINTMRAYELKKLNPSLMNDDQLLAGSQRAVLFGLRELALEMLLELKSRPGKEEFAVTHMGDLFDHALRCRDKELTRKLTLHIPADKLYFNEANKLQHALLEDASRYEELETFCRKAVVGDDQSPDHELLELGYAFDKTLPAMSIVFSRAAIVSEPERWFDNEILLESIQRNRIALDLEPWGDPIEEYLDWTIGEKHQSSAGQDKDRKIEQLKKQLAEAADKTALAAKELRAKKLELANREKKTADSRRDDSENIAKPSTAGQQTQEVTGVATPDEERIQQINRLRKKIATLKSEISSHQESRRQYRQQLQEADRVISKLSRLQPAPDNNPPLLEESDPEIFVPKKILVPEFADSFRKSCDNLPQAIVTKALQAAIAFATRDSAILRQAAVLERLPGVFRLRIGIHYRLLVRQTPEETLQILDIIPRSRLETWIRHQSS